MKKELSWKPIRLGPVFCSPACGRGCTVEEYETAVARAEAMVQSLGERWQPDVHENLGWHAAVTLKHGDVRVCWSRIGQFSAYVLGGQFCANGVTAKSALRKAVACAKTTADKILYAVIGL
jgi:hypothetical protein